MLAFRHTVKSSSLKLVATRTPQANRFATKMSAAVGDAVPSVTMYGASPGDKINLAEHVGTKTTVMFGVPGAFTPGCSKTHLPGYIQAADDFKAAGVDELICVAVNDPFVMAEWGKAQGADGKVTMLADTQMELTNAWDIVLDAEGALGNKRCKRFSAVLKDGKIAALNVEADGSGLACSLADVALEQVKEL